MNTSIRHEERERELIEIARLAMEVAEQHTGTDHQPAPRLRRSRRLFGARRGYWFALAFVVGFQIIGQPVSWRWPL